MTSSWFFFSTHKPQDFGLVKLLNTDYKIIMRLITNRLLTSLPYVLHLGKECGDPDCNISHAFALLRDTVVCSVMTGKPIRLLSLDFSSAFYRISQADLLSMLRSYGCNVQIIRLINSVRENTTTEIQINGHC